MKTLSKLALLVPDGVGVRNFLLGNFLRRIDLSIEVDIFHVISGPALRSISSEHGNNIHWHELPPYRPNQTALILQTALGYAQMYWADTMAMRRVRNTPARGTWQQRALTHGTKALGRMSAGPLRMRLLDRLHYAAAGVLPEVDHYKQVFERIQPSVLFCSHQRPSIVLPAILAARCLGIPTATFIFSWDNITSKGRITAPFDHYLVWSNHMRDELLRYYPSVPADCVHVVGTPQFEPYADPDLLWSREEFYSRIGGDPARPLICYSGGDPGTCPEDQEHVRVLLELIRAGRIKRNCQVIVRPVPVEDARRYDGVRASFPELIFARPKWEHTAGGDWSRVIPTKEDIQFLANLTYHCDLNVNLGSTMTLDFGIRNKPVVNIAFDVADPPLFGMSLWDYYYFFDHYRPVVELKAARPARSADQLADLINTYLENPELDAEGRNQLVNMQIGVPLAESSDRILDALHTVAGGIHRGEVAGQGRLARVVAN
jgi:hypothetical protein